MTLFITWIIQLLFVPALSPLFVGATRKIKARFQNRRGASVFQPYRDLWKLLHKEEKISSDASFVFRYAPFIVFGVTIFLGAIIPLSFIESPLASMGDFLVVVYLIALGTFFLALAGMDTGGAFGGFGSSREMFVSSLAEGGLVMSLLVLALVSHSTNLSLISDSMGALSFSNLIPVALAFVGYVIIMLAETGRFPFDNPATHLELTMIHEAVLIEYSGKRLALMEWAAANKYLIFIILGVNLFIPFGMAGAFRAGFAIGAGFLLAKIILSCFGVALLESSTAKFRLFRLPDLLFTSFIISIIAIVLTF